MITKIVSYLPIDVYRRKGSFNFEKWEVFIIIKKPLKKTYTLSPNARFLQWSKRNLV